MSLLLKIYFTKGWGICQKEKKTDDEKYEIRFLGGIQKNIMGWKKKRKMNNEKMKEGGGGRWRGGGEGGEEKDGKMVLGSHGDRATHCKEKKIYHLCFDVFRWV